jgi:hypothetical protein
MQVSILARIAAEGHHRAYRVLLFKGIDNLRILVVGPLKRRYEHHNYLISLLCRQFQHAAVSPYVSRSPKPDPSNVPFAETALCVTRIHPISACYK